MSTYTSKLKILRIVAIELEILSHIFKLPNYTVTNMNYSSPDSAEQAEHLQCARRLLLQKGKAVSHPVHSAKKGKETPSRSLGARSSAVWVWRGRWHSSLISSTCSTHSLFTGASKQELGLKTGPEKFLCHLLPCPSTQLPETHGKGLSVFFTISIDSSIHIQGHYLKHTKTKQQHSYRLQISSISQTCKVRARGESLKVILFHHQASIISMDASIISMDQLRTRSMELNQGSYSCHNLPPLFVTLSLRKY